MAAKACVHLQSKKLLLMILLYNLVQASMVKPKAFLKAIELAKYHFLICLLSLVKSFVWSVQKFYATQYALVSFVDKGIKYFWKKRKGFIFFQMMTQLSFCLGIFLLIKMMMAHGLIN